MIIDDWSRNKDSAELLDIIANFQEGFNTNLHCMELCQCILDNGFTRVKRLTKEDILNKMADLELPDRELIETAEAILALTQEEERDDRD